MGFRNNFATFEAREAERITGVGVVLQREWRRRGHFTRAGDGRADHDVLDLARLLVMRALAERGVGPSDSAAIAQSAALRIGYFALSHPGAIADNTGGEFTRGMKLRKRPLASAFIAWTNGPRDPRQYLVVADDGFSFTNDLHKASLGLAAVILDLDALGMLIATRAGRPLATVEIAQAAGRTPAQAKVQARH